MDNNGEAYATVLIIDGTRVNDVRVYEDGIVPTVISRYGTGGGNVPMVFEPGSLTRNAGSKPNELVAPTLRANMGDNQPAVVYPIDDARELEKHQNGTGIGDEGAPAYTLDRQQAPAVVVAPTLMTHNTWSPSSDESVSIQDAVRKVTGIVRRLTPVECERLQGFPDNWTDGQADGSRYKQMGNAVAVPVVEWIISRMVGEDD
jgi:DNA (cytosine-5)-methyltransferase 1